MEPLSAVLVVLLTQEISKQLTVGYATRLVDMNADNRPDIVVAIAPLRFRVPVRRPR